MSKREQGFTLIELLIVVVIIGILAAIAVPAYQSYILRARLVEATNQLSADRVAMEQFYADNRAYTTVNAAFPTPCGGGGTTDFSTANLVGFTMSCTTGLVNGILGYTITATGGKIPSTTGFKYTIDNVDLFADFGQFDYQGPTAANELPSSSWPAVRFFAKASIA